jgi:hypothetical protein
MALSIDVSVREEVASYFVLQMEQASQAKRERLTRLLINRLPRYVIDGMYLVAQVQTNEEETIVTETE